LREPFVARALALLHGDITRRWTVDELGREVGLSRSALADRFIRLIGVPPMHYLTSWRMQVATDKLRSTNMSLAQVAEMVGYDSEAAFSRAFKKHSVRRSHLATVARLACVEAESAPPQEFPAYRAELRRLGHSCALPPGLYPPPSKRQFR
jgi:AraC-like DNA-binding protein